MQKSKRDEAPRAGYGCFVLVWTGVLTLVDTSLVILLIRFLAQFLDPKSLGFVAVVNALNASVFAFCQIYLVQFLLRRSMRGWYLTVLAALAVSWLLYVASVFRELDRLGGDGLSIYGIINQILATAPIALFQGVWFSRRVERAWIWPLVLIVMSVLFFIPFSIMSQSPAVDMVSLGLFILIRTVVANLIMGLVMYVLMSRLNAREIARLEAADEAVRLAHLQAMEMQSANETVISRVYQEESA